MRYRGVEDITFEGGGAKGLAFSRVVDLIDWRDVKRVRGSSAGAIAAVMAAAGHGGRRLEELLDPETMRGFFDRPALDPRELEEGTLAGLLVEVDVPGAPDFIKRALDRALLRALNRRGRGRKALGLLERGGLYAGDALLAWLEARTGSPGRPPATLRELRDTTGVELEIVATDVTAHRALYLSAATAPDCPAAAAARMSAGVPLVWEPIAWRAEWGAYEGEPLEGHVCVDGGLLDNFPLARATGEYVGFLIDEDGAVPGQEDAAAGARGRVEDFRLAGYASDLVCAVVESSTRRNIAEADPARVCRLPAKGYGTLEFDMAQSRRAALLDAAEAAARETLERMYG